MVFYKKVLLTLSGAGMMMSCVPVSIIKKPVSARVVSINKNTYDLDTDNDGLADHTLFISNSKLHNQCYFSDYIQVGDSLHYRTTPCDVPTEMTADLYRDVVLDSVNNKSVKDLQRIYKEKHICKIK